MTDKNTNASEHWVCDFCSDPFPTWLYRAKNITYEELQAESLSAWAACADCHDLIEQDKRKELAARVTTIMCDKHPDFEKAYLAQQIATLHASFFRNRIDGPAIKI